MIALLVRFKVQAELTEQMVKENKLFRLRGPLVLYYYNWHRHLETQLYHYQLILYFIIIVIELLSNLGRLIFANVFFQDKIYCKKTLVTVDLSQNLSEANVFISLDI